MSLNPNTKLRPVAPVITTPRAIAALVLREMSSTYGRSPGGYLWAIFEPAAGIAVLTAIFSLGFRAPSLGTSFALFYATGMLPFLMYNIMAQKIAQALIYSRALLEYPRVTFIDAILARMILSMLTQIVVNYIIFTSILLLFNVNVTIDFSKVGLAYLMVISLGLGIGTFNCYLFVAFPVWRNVWGILSRPLFIASCIFFIFESIPQPYNAWLWFNPLVHPVGMMRDGFYPFYHPTYVSLVYVFGFSLVLALAGLLLLRRYHKDALIK